jgi:hypothetical protein
MIEGVLNYAKWSKEKQKIIFEVREDLHFHLSDGTTITIPVGFETDFASVPRWLWSVIPPIGKYIIAAVVHDYLYDNRIGTRKEADKIFLDLMLQYGVHRWGAHCMYWGVRLGGKKWWRE